MIKKILIGTIFVLGILVFPYDSLAAIAIDSEMPSDTGQSVNNANLTYSFTNTAGTLLIVGATAGHLGQTITGVTYAGAAMTEIGHVISNDGANGAYSSMWYKISPATGANDVVVTKSGGAAGEYIISGAISFTGNDMTNPIVTANTETAYGASGSQTVTVTGTTAGNYVVDCVVTGSAVGATSQTLTWKKDVDGSKYGNNAASSYALSGGGNVVMSYGANLDSWGIVAAEVAAAAASVSLDQESFRFRNDDGSETSATWLAAQDATTTQTLDTNTRARFIINASGTPSASQFQLEWSKNSGSWTKLSSSTPIVPTVFATGTIVGGTGAVVATFPAGYQLNDVFIMAVESTQVPTTNPTTTAGTMTWNFVSSSRTYATADLDGTSLWVYWGRASTSTTYTAPTIIDTGNHTIVTMIGIRNATTSGNPIDSWTNGVNNASTTNLAASGTSTLRANSAVVVLATHGRDASAADFSNWTNANLTGIREVIDGGSTAGNGGGFGIMIASSTNIQAFGTTNASTTNARLAWMSLAIAPIITPDLLLVDTANITNNGTSTTPQLTAPSGKTTASSTAGWISDIMNPATSTTIGTDYYSEFEWNFIATSTAIIGDVFGLRITNSGTALDSYSVSSTLTIAAEEEPPPVVAGGRRKSYIIFIN